MLFHPALCGIACADCQKWVYDFDTGKVKEYGGRPRERLPDDPPPCDPRREKETCPKISPGHEGEFVLSRRNARTLAVYERFRATGLLPDELRDDSIFGRNATILASLFDRFEREREAERLAIAVTEQFARIIPAMMFKGGR